MLLRLLRALFRRPAGPPRPLSAPAPPAQKAQKPVLLPGTGRGYFFEVVGESFYQETLRGVCEDKRPEREFYVRLVAEPANVADANAVMVQCHGGVCSGKTIGYLKREHAARYQQLVVQLAERGDAAVCRARLCGGRQQQHFGVYLDLLPPTLVAAQLKLRYTRVRRSTE